jgi:ubiquinone/menaquinone biosynthesis C-methylase UbiE
MTYEQQAEEWIRLARGADDAYWVYRDAFFALVPGPPARTLEVGCGEGRVARDLAGRGYEVVGIDGAPSLIEAARELDPTGEYLVAEATALPLDDESFDLAVAYNSLMDVDDLDGTVKEAWRVLRHGGRFCICVTHPVNDAGRFEHREPGAAFHIDVYRGRRRFELTVTHEDSEFTFASWAYPLEGYTRPLEDAGFLIEAFREPAVDRSSIAPRGERRLRIPNFLLIRAVKPA